MYRSRSTHNVYGTVTKLQDEQDEQDELAAESENVTMQQRKQ